MAGLLNDATASAKILYCGDSGVGKTGSKAALIACGYKYRMLDSDNGMKILRSRLTDEEHYPYASWIKKTGLDLNEPGRLSFIPIDAPVSSQSRTVQDKNGIRHYNVIAPENSRAWNDVVARVAGDWIDEDWGNLGKLTDWENDTIFDIDTVATLAELAKYWNQDMNGRLGALEDDHGRDTGAAQELIRRLMLKLTSSLVKCNVIATTHIVTVDMSRGTPLNVGQLVRDKKSTDPRGFPAAIGNAFSTVMGKRWNDQLIAWRDGDRQDAERKISSLPVNNTNTKSSVWLEDSYDIETGLAEIFAAQLYKPYPQDFVDHCRKFKETHGGDGTSASKEDKPKSKFGSF